MNTATKGRRSDPAGLPEPTRRIWKKTPPLSDAQVSKFFEAITRAREATSAGRNA